MTQDEIIEMYMQVSKELCNDTEWCWAGVGEPLQMFAKLVAAKEREALAKEKTLQALHDENKRLGLYKDAYAQPEPVVVVCCQQYDTCLKPCTPRGRHLAQRIWVGLKDEDISEIVRGTHNTGSFVRAIEAKLKEKNSA